MWIALDILPPTTATKFGWVVGVLVFGNSLLQWQAAATSSLEGLFFSFLSGFRLLVMFLIGIISYHFCSSHARKTKLPFFFKYDMVPTSKLT